MPPESHAAVLVVDDSRLILEMVRDAFVQAGYGVETALNGEEALQQVLSKPPDVIVSDIVMPVMDGWALFDALQNHPELRAVPFIFLTSEREAAKRVRGLRMGALDYLTKPFSVEELIIRVERILERQKVVDAERKNTLSGHTSHLALPDLLQILVSNARTGALVLRSGEDEGRILIREGEVVQAQAPGVAGRKGLFRLLRWDEAEFLFESGLVPTLEGEIVASTSRLLMDGVVDADEVAARPHLTAEGAVLRLRAEARDRVISEGMSHIEFEVTRGVKQGWTTREILDRCHEPDGEILLAIEGLIQRGVLESEGPAAAKQESPD